MKPSNFPYKVIEVGLTLGVGVLQHFVNVVYDSGEHHRVVAVLHGLTVDNVHQSCVRVVKYMRDDEPDPALAFHNVTPFVLLYSTRQLSSIRQKLRTICGAMAII